MVFAIFGATLIMIIIMLKAKLPIGLTLYSAAALLMILSGGNVPKLIDAFIHSALAWETNKLILIVLAIIALGKVMELSGSMKVMIEAIEDTFPKYGIAGAVMPAIIGLFPMPGGALLSAPMVGSVNKLKEIDVDVKAAINYWFRHIWECVWPLYPGIILTAAITNVSIGTIISYQWPVSVLFVIFGIIVFRRVFSANSEEGANLRWSGDSAIKFLISVAPIFAVVILKFAFGLDFLVSLSIMIFIVALINHKKISPLKSLIKSIFNLETILLIEAVMALKSIIGVSGLSAELVDALSKGNILLPVLASIVALIIGIITGTTPAFVGVAFPLVAPLMKAQTGYGIGYLVYVSGFIGVMLSPAHLCLLLSKEYFKADLGGIYKIIIVPLIIIFILAVLIYLFLYA